MFGIFKQIRLKYWLKKKSAISPVRENGCCDFHDSNGLHKAIAAFGFYNNHVIRAPIVRIRGLVNLALHEYNNSPEELRDILLKIKDCANELDEKTRRHNKNISN